MTAPAARQPWFARTGAEPAPTAELLMMGGTWNPKGDGVTHAFVDQLDPRIKVTYVDYPASPQFGTSIPAGEAALRKALATSRATYRIVGGFSQGAIIAGNVARPPGDVRPQLCALIADPRRAPGSPTLNRGVGGSGILGGRRVAAVPLLQVAASGDPIAALPEGSPIRSLGDALSDAQPNMDAWARAMTRRIAARNFQRWWQPNYWQDWAGASGWMVNYFSGRHTDAYVREGLCALLAHEVNARVRAAL